VQWIVILQFDANKQLIATGDAFPDAIATLAKGKYTLRLQLKHADEAVLAGRRWCDCSCDVHSFALFCVAPEVVRLLSCRLFAFSAHENFTINLQLYTLQ
jgi:hypothetical protein